MLTTITSCCIIGLGAFLVYNPSEIPAPLTKIRSELPLPVASNQQPLTNAAEPNLTEQVASQQILAPAMVSENTVTQPKIIVEEAVTKAPQLHWIERHIKPGDSLAKVFAKNNLSSKTLHDLLELKKIKQYLNKIKPNQLLRIGLDSEDKFKALELDLDFDKQVRVEQLEDKLKANIINRPIEERYLIKQVSIKDSLFLSGQRAGLKDKTIMELANIFGWDVDFALDIRPNDKFKVIYKEYFLNNQRQATGPIIAAEFINNGKKYYAFRYKDEKGKIAYYSNKGKNLKKAFIRTPVKFTRISSRFSLGRKHPVLHKIRAHRGVDYAAPTGTPVKASGNGRVSFVGKKGGYGNAVILNHGKKYSTLYGHLSRFRKGLKVGSKVTQGQVIAYVGSTGLATGPHLHYEFRINGVHHNPLTVPLPNAKPISKNALAQFQKFSNKIIAYMDDDQSYKLAYLKIDEIK